MSFPRVIGNKSVIDLGFPEAPIRRFARRNRHYPTPAEREFQRFLNGLNGGVLKGRFRFQHVVSGKWIVDFFFPEVRLAVEIDGSTHHAASQRARDLAKEIDCKRFDITLLRLTNREVRFGNRDRLTERLREGWRLAKRRENMIVGRGYQGA